MSSFGVPGGGFGALANQAQLQQQLPPGVMMNAVFTFQDVPQEAFPETLQLAARNHTWQEDVHGVEALLCITQLAVLGPLRLHYRRYLAPVY